MNYWYTKLENSILEWIIYRYNYLRISHIRYINRTANFKLLKQCLDGINTVHRSISFIVIQYVYYFQSLLKIFSLNARCSYKEEKFAFYSEIFCLNMMTYNNVRVYANFKKLYNLLLCKIFEIWYIKIGWNSSKLNNTKPMPLTLDHCSVIIKYFSLFFNKTSLGNWLCRIFFFLRKTKWKWKEAATQNIIKLSIFRSQHPKIY